MPRNDCNNNCCGGCQIAPYYPISSHSGRPGPMGPRGATGATGAQGAIGLQGPAGPQGPMGLQGVAGPRGASGSQGPTGAAGAAILDSYASYAELIAAHPTGTAGDAYLAGGELYVWNAATGMWENMGSIIGPTGPTGAAGATILDSYTDYDELVNAHPTGTNGDAYLAGGELYVWEDDHWEDMGRLVGPTGPTGAAGATILDSYADYNELVNAHPTGTNGDAYLAGGELYVWEDDHWEDMGSLIGPTGPTGADGADGLIGKINGVADTAGDLPTAGVEQGMIYYVEDTGSLYVWDADTGQWVLLDVAQGPRGVTGPTGPTGPAGADGLVGEIAGVVETVDDLPSTGIATGTLYYVEADDSVYVWDGATSEWVLLDMAQGPRGATGATGATGAAGSAASSYMIIPFASAEAPKTFANNGNPSTVSLIGFGYGDRRDYLDLDAANYSIPIDASDHGFSLTSVAGNDNKQLVFSLPFDVSIRSIYITVGNYGNFDPPVAVFPFIQLYSAPAGTNTFLPIPGALAKPTVGIGPGTGVPADSMRSAHTDGLDIKLAAGTRIGIGAMMEMPGDTSSSRDYWIYFTGGIGLTYEP